jgi:Tfp pilus assembly protein PilV
MLNNTKSLTLVELIIASILMGVAILGITSLSSFFINQISANFERQKAYSQIDFTFEDMKLRCLSASQISSTTTFTTGGSRQDLEFEGENDIYTVNPEMQTSATKRCYKYYVNSNGDLVLRTTTLTAGCLALTNKCPCAGGTSSEEILLDKDFKPSNPATNFLSFKHTTGTEPNFLTVTINAECEKSPLGADKTISKDDGLRFWFVEPVM